MEEETQTERKARLQREANARWRARNPDKVKAQNAKRYAANPGYVNEWNRRNPEKVRANRARTNAKPETVAWRKRWREENADKIKAYQAVTNAKDHPTERMRRWRAKNGDKNREANTELKRNWREANLERHKEVRRVWEQENRELLLTYSAKRRTQTSTGRLSRGLVALLLEEQGSKCPYCFGAISKSRYSMDHYMPLALGGDHHDWNIQLTCGPCNSSKRDKHPDRFLNQVLKKQGLISA